MTELHILTSFRETEERLSGENIPQGVANAWDHPYVTSQTLPPTSKTMQASQRPEKPEKSEERGKKKPQKPTELTTWPKICVRS